MTIDEIKQRLAEIEPEEQRLWAQIKEIDEKSRALAQTWLPIYSEVNKLRDALEVMQGAGGAK